MGLVSLNAYIKELELANEGAIQKLDRAAYEVRDTSYRMSHVFTGCLRHRGLMGNAPINPAGWVALKDILQDWIDWASDQSYQRRQDFAQYVSILDERVVILMLIAPCIAHTGQGDGRFQLAGLISELGKDQSGKERIFRITHIRAIQGHSISLVKVPNIGVRITAGDRSGAPRLD